MSSLVCINRQLDVARLPRRVNPLAVNESTGHYALALHAESFQHRGWLLLRIHFSAQDSIRAGALCRRERQATLDAHPCPQGEREQH